MSNSDLILIELYKLSKRKKIISSEELTVHVFNAYPKIFAMKEYPKFPSTNIVFRMISTLNSEGYIRLVKQNISITNKGIEFAKLMRNKINKVKQKAGHLNRIEVKELNRLMSLTGFEIFNNDKNKQPLDVDTYEFYGITVRTSIKDIEKKRDNINSIIKKIKNHQWDQYIDLLIYKDKVDKILEGIIDEYNTAKN